LPFDQQQEALTMRVMVVVKANKESESGAKPDPKIFEEMGKFNEELAKAGILVAAEGLRASSLGKRVHFSGAKRTVIDGPFAETKELIAGYWIWKVKSMDEALEWVKRCPNPHQSDSDIDIRPLYEMEDFGPEFTPELREQEERLRKQLP
jgi:hypothetical protein